MSQDLPTVGSVVDGDLACDLNQERAQVSGLTLLLLVCEFHYETLSTPLCIPFFKVWNLFPVLSLSLALISTAFHYSSLPLLCPVSSFPCISFLACPMIIAAARITHA